MAASIANLPAGAAESLTDGIKDMLLVLPVPFRLREGKLLWDSQACNGIKHWSDNFGTLIIAASVIPEWLAERDRSATWTDLATLADPHRYEFVKLPWSYALGDYLKTYASTRQQLAGLVKRSRYVQVAIGGLFGDWGSIAALEANRQGRACAIHADRVEHQVVLNVSRDAGWKAKAKARVNSWLMARFEKYVIQKGTLGLWHGKDCFAAYSPFCKVSHLVHDIHTQPEDAISPDALRAKIDNTSSDKLVRICYAGRIAAMKAPLEWVRAIAYARDKGVNLHATWFGDGEQREEMQALVTELNLGSSIRLHGMERDRMKLLDALRQSHMMVFTHVTPESPRCLIEALVSGAPIVGYASSYVDELTEDLGGGRFVAVHDWQALGQQIVELDQDRQALARLIEAAGHNGSRFNDRDVFRERSELIKRHLGQRPTEAKV